MLSSPSRYLLLSLQPGCLSVRYAFFTTRHLIMHETRGFPSHPREWFGFLSCIACTALAFNYMLVSCHCKKTISNNALSVIARGWCKKNRRRYGAQCGVWREYGGWGCVSM